MTFLMLANGDQLGFRKVQEREHVVKKRYVADPKLLLSLVQLVVDQHNALRCK